MATLQEILSTVRTLLVRVPTDELDVSDAQLEHFVNMWRSKLLRQDLSDGKIIGGAQEQTLCLVLRRLENSEKNYLRICRSYQSVKFPTLLHSKYGEHVARVAERPLEPSYKLTTFSNLVYLLAARLTSKSPKAILADERLYVYSKEPIDEVYLTGVFENPREVHEWLGLADPFHPYEFPYPLSDTYLDALYRGIQDTTFRTLKSTIVDTANDGHIPTPQQ